MYHSVPLLCRILVVSLLMGWHFDTQAAATITFSQVGNDVQATISGSFNLTGLIAGTTTTPNARVRGGGSGANVVIGPAGGASTKFYSTITGPTYIGCSTNTIDASSGTANPSGMFGINMAPPARLLVPQNYNSDANVSASATWNGATINSLGLTVGTYRYTWPGDSLTIIVPSGGASCGTTAGGTVNATVAGGIFQSTQFTTPTNPPVGQSFPYGVFGFTAATNTLGGSITITLIYPQALAAGSKIWKNINGTWLDYTSNVTFNQSRTTITYTIVDGGPFDSDGLVNQSVTDPIGPANPPTPTPSPAPIPTLSEWAQIMMMFMIILTVGWHFRKQQN